MSRKGSITYQIKNELLTKCRFGESRDEAKKNGTAYKYIYSYGTLNTYMKQLNYMVKWARNNKIKLKSIDDIAAHGDEWLQYCLDQGMSAWTLTTRRAAICKLCNLPYSHFKTKIPIRTRSSVKRSRNKSLALKHFSEEKNSDQVTFCKCTGLRASELSAITGDRLYFNNKKPFLHVTEKTKGGRPREVELYGSPQEINKCIQLCKEAGKNKVFEKVKENANTHGYRSDYAKRVYFSNARSIDEINDRNEIMFCRKDKKGIVYDKNALKICSENLGHSRIDIVSTSYLYENDAA